jgi:hypothetical protein
VTVATGHEARGPRTRDTRRLACFFARRDGPHGPSPECVLPHTDGLPALIGMDCRIAFTLLSFVCIVPASKQHAFLKIRTGILRFVTIPVVLPALVEAIASSLPRIVQRARGFSAPVDPEEMSDSRRLYGQIHSVRQMVSTPIPVDAETPKEVVKHDEAIATQVATKDPA